MVDTEKLPFAHGVCDDMYLLLAARDWVASLKARFPRLVAAIYSQQVKRDSVVHSELGSRAMNVIKVSVI